MIKAATDLINAKRLTIKTRKMQEVNLESQLTSLNDDGEVTSGCGMCAIMFRGNRKNDGPRVAGAKAGAANAGWKLQQAQVSLKERTDRLRERMVTSRGEAAALLKLGKKTEALAAMRRAKTAEKQFMTASSAVDALDNQILALEEASLQQEIASALSFSVQNMKKTTKGLLNKTELAVDGSAEVKDLTEDVNSALEGLQSTVVDDDELLDELEAMISNGGEDADAAAATASTLSADAETEIQKAWPAAPMHQRKGSRKRTDGFRELLPSAAH